MRCDRLRRDALVEARPAALVKRGAACRVQPADAERTGRFGVPYEREVELVRIELRDRRIRIVPRAMRSLR
jgi:hypothetical protein